jgi:PEP-CTERM motif
MKKFLLLSAMALAMTVGASATTLLVNCGNYSASSLNGVGVSGTLAGGSISCGSFSITGGNTISAEQLVFQSDYTSGNIATNTTTTTWGSPVSISNNIVSGSVTSSTYSAGALAACTSGNCDVINSSSYFVTGNLGTGAFNSGFSVTYSDVLTAGQVSTVSGNLYELITYSSQQSTPEPTSFILMGAGLGVVGLLRRRAARQ